MATPISSHFTLDRDDIRWLGCQRVPANRLGLAVQLYGLRYLGFIPADLASVPRPVLERIAADLDVAPHTFETYLTLSDRVRRDHIAAAIRRAGWQTCERGEWKRLRDWLVERALEHDTPSVLFRQALEYLSGEKVVRPGLERQLPPGLLPCGAGELRQ